MLRTLLQNCFRSSSALRACAPCLTSVTSGQTCTSQHFSVLALPSPQMRRCDLGLVQPTIKSSLIGQPVVQTLAANLLQQPSRTMVKFSLTKGKRKTVKSVPARFFRLDWGNWIRRMAGAHKKHWKKTHRRKKRLLRHVFVNSTQSYMLDKMVAPYWRTPKYYVDDPYAPYHKREEFFITRTKPLPAPPHLND